jgi:hypothetical protein
MHCIGGLSRDTHPSGCATSPTQAPGTWRGCCWSAGLAAGDGMVLGFDFGLLQMGFETCRRLLHSRPEEEDADGG